MCVGFCVVVVLLAPDEGSPKFQLQLFTFALEASVNLVSLLRHTGGAVKPAVTKLPVMVTGFVMLSLQPAALVTTSFT